MNPEDSITYLLKLKNIHKNIIKKHPFTCSIILSWISMPYHLRKFSNTIFIWKHIRIYRKCPLMHSYIYISMFLNRFHNPDLHCHLISPHCMVNWRICYFVTPIRVTQIWIKDRFVAVRNHKLCADESLIVQAALPIPAS